ncbi:MAG TPA: enoyl-CoA hydratase/isomerase family protein [Acidimicrobiia bacterium]|nr:enoyl-CoA hydratase/isomerase family protein [Acidimicrobiia bacterium]
MPPEVDLTVDDGISWLVLRRPENRNAVDPAFVEAAVEALDDIPDGAGALVLAAEGPAFSVGADLGFFHSATSSGRADELLTPLLVAMHTIVRRLRALPIPTVAAVEGPAAGAGIGLACACDLRVVGESTVFVPAFTAIGVSPDSGTSYHFTRALGGMGANAAFLRNRRIGAFELLTVGLADEVAPDGEVWATAQRLAGEVAGAAPGALLATRRLVDSAPTHSFDEHLDAEEASIKALWNSAEVAERVAAFVERRRPASGGS